MNATEHWQQIKRMNPQYAGDSTRGHDFRPYQAKRFTRSQLLWSAILALGVMMIAGGYMGMVR